MEESIEQQWGWNTSSNNAPTSSTIPSSTISQSKKAADIECEWAWNSTSSCRDQCFQQPISNQETQCRKVSVASTEESNESWAWNSHSPSPDLMKIPDFMKIPPRSVMMNNWAWNTNSPISDTATAASIISTCKIECNLECAWAWNSSLIRSPTLSIKVAEPTSLVEERWGWNMNISESTLADTETTRQNSESSRLHSQGIDEMVDQWGWNRQASSDPKETQLQIQTTSYSNMNLAKEHWSWNCQQHVESSQSSLSVQPVLGVCSLTDCETFWGWNMISASQPDEKEKYVTTTYGSTSTEQWAWSSSGQNCSTIIVHKELSHRPISWSLNYVESWGWNTFNNMASSSSENSKYNSNIDCWAWNSPRSIDNSTSRISCEINMPSPSRKIDCVFATSDTMSSTTSQINHNIRNDQEQIEVKKEQGEFRDIHLVSPTEVWGLDFE